MNASSTDHDIPECVMTAAVLRHLSTAASGSEWAAYEVAKALRGNLNAYIAACDLGGVPVHVRMRGWGLYRSRTPVI